MTQQSKKEFRPYQEHSTENLEDHVQYLNKIGRLRLLTEEEANSWRLARKELCYRMVKNRDVLVANNHGIKTTPPTGYIRLVVDNINITVKE